MFRVVTRTLANLLRSLHLPWMAWLLVWVCAAPLAHAAEGIEITQARLEYTDDGVKLAANYNFDLNESLTKAIDAGVPLRFTTEVDISRPRWYWLDENVVSTSRTVQLSRNILTGQYRVTVLGGVPQTTDSLPKALDMLRRPSRWVVLEKSALKSGTDYKVNVRMRLDVDNLSMPIQVQVLSPGSEWRLHSPVKSFMYRVES